MDNFNEERNVKKLPNGMMTAIVTAESGRHSLIQRGDEVTVMEPVVAWCSMTHIDKDGKPVSHGSIPIGIMPGYKQAVYDDLLDRVWDAGLGKEFDSLREWEDFKDNAPRIA